MPELKQSSARATARRIRGDGRVRREGRRQGQGPDDLQPTPQSQFLQPGAEAVEVVNPNGVLAVEQPQPPSARAPNTTPLPPTPTNAGPPPGPGPRGATPPRSAPPPPRHNRTSPSRSPLTHSPLPAVRTATTASSCAVTP